MQSHRAAPELYADDSYLVVTVLLVKTTAQTQFKPFLRLFPVGGSSSSDATYEEFSRDSYCAYLNSE